MIQRGGEVVLQMLSNARASDHRTFDSKYDCPWHSHLHGRIQDLCSQAWNGATSTKACVMPKESTRETKMAMVSTKFTSTLWEGFWSLLRSWLRPHRGISQAKLPLYLGFFEFVHNARKRGKALFSALLECLLT